MQAFYHGKICEKVPAPIYVNEGNVATQSLSETGNDSKTVCDSMQVQKYWISSGRAVRTGVIYRCDLQV